MSKDFNADFRETVIARLVIYGLPDMNAGELRRLGVWLKRQQEHVESMASHKTKDKYSKRFIARLMK